MESSESWQQIRELEDKLAEWQLWIKALEEDEKKGAGHASLLNQVPKVNSSMGEEN